MLLLAEEKNGGLENLKKKKKTDLPTEPPELVLWH